MKFKHLILVSLLLAVLTVGGVSAADDAGALAVDDTGDDPIVESPADENILADPDPADFNVVITDKELSYDDETPAITFNWPSYVGEDDSVDIQVNSEPSNSYYKDAGETSKKLSLGQLYITEPGTYNVTVSYKSLELAKGTLKADYAGYDYISINDDVFSNEEPVAVISNPTGAGVNGLVSIFVEGNLACSKKVTSNPGEDAVIYGSDLNGYFNGNYEVKVVYKASNGKEYSNLEYTSFENVGTKEKTTIVALPVKTVYNGNKYITAILKDKNGKAISGETLTIKFFGVNIPKQTDKNGQVKLAINGVDPGKYNAKITFAGKGKYEATSKSVPVTISKATPKLTAYKKTFKKSVATKKYTVTLKDTLGNVNYAKIALKVNGKTFKAYTSKGTATFKITNLKKKGTFTASVKFAGNRYYNAVARSVKITVK